MSTVSIRCEACYASGYTTNWDSPEPVREICVACHGRGTADVARPKKSRLNGVTRADAWIDLEARGEYTHPTLVIYASHGEDASRVCSLRFQRHENRSATGHHTRPDPRLDVGAVAWSACYCGRFDEHFTIDERKLREAARIAGKLMGAMRTVPRIVECEMARCIDALEILGVPVAIHYWHRGMWHDVPPADVPLARAAGTVAPMWGLRGAA